jgi:hypothetical protein
LQPLLAKQRAIVDLVCLKRGICLKYAHILCLAFYERDPVDLALDWAAGEDSKVPVIIPANDERAGGDWEAGIPSILLSKRFDI